MKLVKSTSNMYRISPQVTSLYNALINRGIKCILEEDDGYKHIDISIDWAKIDIEIDGLHHYTDPTVMKSDLLRSQWSLKRDMFNTIHIPNIIIDSHLEKVADAIAIVARKRLDEIKAEKKNKVKYFFKKLFW